MLFDSTRKHTKQKSALHYGSKEKALQTIQYLLTKPYGEKIRSAQTMYFRAKYHAHQTPGMRDAMKVYANYLAKTKRQKHTK